MRVDGVPGDRGGAAAARMGLCCTDFGIVSTRSAKGAEGHWWTVLQAARSGQKRHWRTMALLRPVGVDMSVAVSGVQLSAADPSAE